MGVKETIYRRHPSFDVELYLVKMVGHGSYGRWVEDYIMLCILFAPWGPPWSIDVINLEKAFGFYATLPVYPECKWSAAINRQNLIHINCINCRYCVCVRNLVWFGVFQFFFYFMNFQRTMLFTTRKLCSKNYRTKFDHKINIK